MNSSQLLNLKSLSDNELHKNTLKSAEDEKNATFTLMEHLAEVEDRGLFLTLGFGSLFMYVHKSLNYSEPQSSDRVNAMRLMKKVPEVKKSIEEGLLTLTSTSKIARHVRQKKLNLAETEKLIKECEGKSTRHIEKILLPDDGTENPHRIESIKPLTKSTTRLILEVDEEFMNLLSKVKELSGSFSDSATFTFTKTMKEFIKRREPKVKLESEEKLRAHEVQSVMNEVAYEVKTASSKNASKPNQNLPEPPAEFLTAKSRYISTEIKNKIRIRSKNQCEYIYRTKNTSDNAATNTRCETRHHLHFDHIQPYALGGSNAEQNIRHLCSNHNQHEAKKYFG